MTNKNAGVLKMLKTALEMEEAGKGFYEKAAATCTNELGREMFSSLMADEIVHMQRIQEIFESIQGTEKWTKEWEKIHSKGHSDLRKVFGEFTKKHGPHVKADSADIQALSVGIDLEQKAITYYEDHLKTATDEIERAFLKKMIVEEHKHHEILSDTKLYLTDPAAWFVESEHSSVDGG